MIDHYTPKHLAMAFGIAFLSALMITAFSGMFAVFCEMASPRLVVQNFKTHAQMPNLSKAESMTNIDSPNIFASEVKTFEVDGLYGWVSHINTPED